MARSAIAFAFLALAASASTSSVAATSRHLLQAAPGAQVQSTAPLNLPPGVSLTSPDGSAPKMPTPGEGSISKAAAAAAAAQKEVVDQQTMRQFQALDAQRDLARSADPSSDPLNAPRDDVLKTVTLPTAEELKEFAESEQVKQFREALAAAPALPAVAAPKIPFINGGMPPAPPKPPKPKPPSPPPAPPPPPSPPPPPPPPPPAPPPGPQGFLDGPFAPEGYDFWSKWAGIPISPVRATYYVGWVSQCSQDSRQGGVAGLRNVHMPVTQDCSNNSKKANK